MDNYMKMIEDEPQQNECVICFNTVDENNTHIKCSNCGKLYHKSCMDKWRFKKKDICNCPSFSFTNRNSLLNSNFVTCFRIKF